MTPKKRTSPTTLLECQPGDVVCVREHGKILVTGNNIGARNTARLVRKLDEDGKEGEAFPLATSVLITRIVELRY